MKIPSEDSRARASKEGEYLIKVFGDGLVVCATPGVELIDFYRTSMVLARDVAPKARICVACKCEIVGMYAYTDELNPICQPCARKRAGI